jgi:hypothetical protein
VTRRRISAAVARSVAFACAAAWLISTAGDAAAQTAQARITRAIKDVKLVSTQGSARAVVANDRPSDDSILRTGVDSRAEIAFAGPSIARLGGKTAVRSRNQARELELREGAVLFQVPAGVYDAKITTGGINVAPAGTTGIIERFGSSYVKILVLEGTARVYVDTVGESVLVNPGQLLITKPGAKTLPEAVHFNIAQLVKTSLLTGRDFAPLASRARIDEQIRKQQNDPNLTPTNLVIYGRGTLVTLVPPTPSPAASPKPRNASRASTRATGSRSN